jgi:hypothetical protein
VILPLTRSSYHHAATSMHSPPKERMPTKETGHFAPLATGARRTRPSHLAMTLKDFMNRNLTLSSALSIPSFNRSPTCCCINTACQYLSPPIIAELALDTSHHSKSQIYRVLSYVGGALQLLSCTNTINCYFYLNVTSPLFFLFVRMLHQMK